MQCLKNYMCSRSKERVSIDGNLDKEVWKAASRVELVDAVTGEKPMQGTNVSLLWDNEFLYIAFDCEDREIRAACTGFNDPLYNEDVMEIYIDDNNDLKTYLEFEVNPRNAILHYMITNNLEGIFLGYARLQNNVVSKVIRKEVEKRTWYEMAIPFVEFATADHIPPKSGDTWKLNLFRVDRGENGQDEYSAWSPTGKVAFHKPKYFGELRFVE